MLDMAFQLLAFFVLTFREPTAETHLDLDLPATPAALPGTGAGPRRASAGTSSTPTSKTTSGSVPRQTTSERSNHCVWAKPWSRTYRPSVNACDVTSKS